MPGEPEVRVRRGWLWLAVALCGLLAIAVGFVIRAALHGGGTEILLIAVLAVLAGLLLLGELVAALQIVQAREAARAALCALPADYRVSGRVRIRGRGRPAVADHVVVCPDGRAFAVTVDGSTRPPRAGDATDGLGPLLDVARYAAESVQEAARAHVLPAELGVGASVRVRPCILVARRPLQTGLREGVLAFAAGEAGLALGPGS